MNTPSLKLSPVRFTCVSSPPRPRSGARCANRNGNTNGRPGPREAGKDSNHAQKLQIHRGNASGTHDHDAPEGDSCLQAAHPAIGAAPAPVDPFRAGSDESGDRSAVCGAAFPHPCSLDYARWDAAGTPRVERRADMTVHSGNTTPFAPTRARARTQPTPQGCAYLAQIVPCDEGERLAQAMENWFGASASDSPFALELAGTSSSQGFVLRASSEAQLTLLCKQFEAQYPQAEIHRIAPGADPLVLQPGEHALVGSFALAQPSWMPLKTFPGKALAEPGTDPLPALLAAMETVGEGEC